MQYEPIEVKRTVKPIHALLLATLLASTSFLPLPAAVDARAGPYPLRVRTEWESGAFNGTVDLILKDIDGDRRQELLAWGDLRDGEGSTFASVMVYRPPSYELAMSANFSSEGSDLRLVDLHQNGSVELLLERSGPVWTNFTVLSGRDLTVLWQGPDLGGRLAVDQITDVDGDGELEFVWANTTSSFDPNFTEVFDSRIHIFGAEGHQKKWESPPIPEQVRELRPVQLDKDAAEELFMVGTLSDERPGSMRVYDGATHALQWMATPQDNLTGLSSIFLGDADNDTRGEVLVRADFGGSSGVRMYDGGNGALLWNRTLGNTTLMAQAADIDSDGEQELLATGSVAVDPKNSTFELTHYVFDLKSRALVWSAGPLVSNNNTNSSLSPLIATSGTIPDIVPRTLPELVLSNVTVTGPASSLVTYEVIDGRTLASRWRSPAFASVFTNYTGGLVAYTGGLMATQADSDGALELVAPEVWLSARPQLTGRVRVFSADDFTEEWSSPVYTGIVAALGYDAVGDSRPELLLIATDIDFTIFPVTFTYQMRILNGDTHALLWTGPRSQREDFRSTDLYGSPRREMVYAAIEDKASGPMSTLAVYNDTALSEAWTTGPVKGSLSIVFAGDADNDTLGELVTGIRWEDASLESFTNITVRELSERAPPLPDLAMARADLTISNQTPVAGMPLTLTARVRNLGPSNASGCSVTFLVDGSPAAESTVDLGAGNLSELVFHWTAAAGEHALTVEVDPQDLIEESNETNNNATLLVSVGARPPPVPVISSPRDGDVSEEGTNISFNATASVFAPGGDRSFYWTSDSSGFIGNSSLFNATLPKGPHHISLFADDSYNNASATVNITVGPPKPPPGTTWAVISSPVDGQVLAAGEPILFDASGSVPARPEYVLTYNWSSNRTGALGTSARFWRAIPAGAHNITLKVDDGHGGLSTASVSVQVNGSGAVAAYITSPLDGQIFDARQQILFDGSGSTGPSGAVLRFEWNSNLSGAIGSGMSFSRSLPAGYHAIGLTVSDGQGHTASASVNISVTGAVESPPSASIAHPAEGATVRGVVNVTGTAAGDAKVILVQVRIDGGPWESASGTENWSYSWNTSRVPNGTHRITVRAQDGRSNSSEAAVNVTVDNPGGRPRPGPRKEPFPLAVLAALAVLTVIVAVALAAYIKLRRGSGGRPPLTDDSESRGPAPPRM